MADTPEETKKREENRNKRLKSLEEAIRKLTDTEDKSVKIAEKLSKKYKSNSEIKIFEKNAHWMMEENNWIEIAEYITDWIE